MKKFFSNIAALVFMVGFALQANAQEIAEASATATATIVAPIDVVWEKDLHFGNIEATNSGGTVVLKPDGTRSADGVQLPASSGTVSAASFTARGEADFAYTISLPVDAHTMKTGSGLRGEVMTINYWSTNATGILTGGAETIHLGATLTVEADQAFGVYDIDKPFTVSVNYY